MKPFKISMSEADVFASKTPRGDVEIFFSTPETDWYNFSMLVIDSKGRVKVTDMGKDYGFRTT